MKNVLVPALSALLATCLTWVGLALVDDARAAAPPQGLQPGAPAAPAAAVPAASSGTALAPLAAPVPGALLERVAALEERLAALESRTPARHPVATAATAAPALAAVTGDEEEARAFVLDVLAAERQTREDEQADEQRERTAARVRERVGRISEELGLSGRDEESLVGIYLVENDRRTELFTRLRTGPYEPDARELVREELGRLRDWKRDELEGELGPALAQQVLAREARRFDIDERRLPRREIDRAGGRRNEGQERER